MGSTSATFASFTSSSHFTTHKFPSKEPTFSVPTRIHFRPLRISAACTTSADERTVSHIANSHSSLYEVLGIQMRATCQEIKAAYRRLARVLHPDVLANNNNQNDTSGANEFIKIHEAYYTLSDPEKRADYDRTLLFRQRRSFSVPIEPMTDSTYSGFSGYTGRTWETDQCW